MKAKTIFVCNECGYESAKWMGKCPACNSWNTFFEEKISTKVESGKREKQIQEAPKPLNSYVGQDAQRTSTGYAELDRVLGGGLVKGSLVLVGGEPGIGKSTLILHIRFIYLFIFTLTFFPENAIPNFNISFIPSFFISASYLLSSI